MQFAQQSIPIMQAIFILQIARLELPIVQLARKWFAIVQFTRYEFTIVQLERQESSYCATCNKTVCYRAICWEVRNSRVTKSSYKTEVRKMTSHLELLTRKFLQKLFFRVTNSAS